MLMLIINEQTIAHFRHKSADTAHYGPVETRRRLHILLLSLASVRPETPVFDSINQCCSLGSYRAKAQAEDCDDLRVPATDIIPELQAPCLSTMELCCANTRRELECEEGRLAALAGEECGLTGGGETIRHGEYFDFIKKSLT